MIALLLTTGFLLTAFTAYYNLFTREEEYKVYRFNNMWACNKCGTCWTSKTTCCELEGKK